MITIRLTDKEAKTLCNWHEVDMNKLEKQFKKMLKNVHETEVYKRNTPELFKGDIKELKKYLDIETIAKLYEEV